MLAPCYRRTSHRGNTEDEDPKAWRKRNDAIFQLLLDLNCDVFCLQEVWFRADFLQVLRKVLEPRYCVHLMQRPHGKEDGLAILFKSTEFEALSVHQRDFKCVGQRIGMAVRVRRLETGEEFLIGNTHLTFPHHAFDYKLRFDQMRNFSTYLVGVHENVPHARMILAGDFNLCTIPEKDNVYQLLKGIGLRSAYCEATGKEPRVTHLTHKNESYCVDFLFFDSRLGVKRTYLHPPHLSDEKWTPEFTLSDHRPVVSEFYVLPKEDASAVEVLVEPVPTALPSTHQVV